MTGDGPIVNRTLASVLGTLAAASVLAIVGFTYSTREDLGDIRISQANAIGEMRLMAQRMEYLTGEYRELDLRMDELERRVIGIERGSR